MILYKKGGFLKRFFGNSQDKFSDMEGAGGGIDMSFKGRFPFAGKGSALRREKRQLKRLRRQGKLGEEGSDRLDYLRNVQKDRAKKLKALGNAIVPQIAQRIGIAIKDSFNEM